MKEFMDSYAQDAQDRLVDLEKPPTADQACAWCDARLPLPSTAAPSQTCRWRCLDCLGRAHFCGACVSKYHRLNPFHRLLRWNPGLGYWEKRAMADHGHVLCYGHGKQMCPERTSPPRELVIVHAGGVTQIKVAFCECKRAALRRALLNRLSPAGLDGASGSDSDVDQELAAKYDREEALQLIDMGLYPGSWQQPRTAFTQDVLRSANLLTLQGGISTQDFYTYLKRTTNNVAPDLVPVSILASSRSSYSAHLEI